MVCHLIWILGLLIQMFTYNKAPDQRVPCGDTVIHLYKGSDSSEHQSVCVSLKEELKESEGAEGK